MNCSYIYLIFKKRIAVFASILISFVSISICAYASAPQSTLEKEKSSFENLQSGQLVRDRAEQYYADRERYLRKQNEKILKDQENILKRLNDFETTQKREKETEKESMPIVEKVKKE